REPRASSCEQSVESCAQPVACSPKHRAVQEEDRLDGGNDFVRYVVWFGGRMGVLVATARWHESAWAGAPAVHLCHFLLSADSAATAEAEKVAGHAERVEERGQSRNQRRPARDDHQPQGRCADAARAARQSEARNQPRIGGIGDDGGGRKVEAAVSCQLSVLS